MAARPIVTIVAMVTILLKSCGQSGSENTDIQLGLLALFVIAGFFANGSAKAAAAMNAAGESESGVVTFWFLLDILTFLGTIVMLFLIFFT